MSDLLPVTRKTKDLRAIKALCVRAGLDMRDGPLQGVVVAYGAFIGRKMVGCATLQRATGGRFLEYVAVDASMRRKGIGALLVSKIEEEAMARGMTELWAKARAPDFYRSIGYRVLGDDERGPKSLESCRECPQFRKNCFPAVVVKQFGKATQRRCT